MLSFKESLPDGMAGDLEQAAKDYDDILSQHVIDLQILGIGKQWTYWSNILVRPISKTHVVDLTDSTKPIAVSLPVDQVPTKASMGIASIMAAKKIILFAYGDKKADAIFKMVKASDSEVSLVSCNTSSRLDFHSGWGCCWVKL